MVTLQIPDELENLIEQGALLAGVSTDEFIRKALLTYMEDRQDAMRAAERVKNVNTRISLDEIGRKYGLAD
jgi:hypothetical protein